MTGGYDYALMGLSILVAMFTAYTVADIIWHTSLGNADKMHARWFWAGGVILGLGAWTAHLIGLLATEEHFSFSYRTDITAISVLFALTGSIMALRLVSHRQKTVYLLGAGMLLGLGLVAMCFIGMHAIFMPGMEHSYDYRLVVLSYAVAAIFSTLALWILQRFYRGMSARPGWEKVIFSVLIASVIIGMHYIDMASMQTATTAGMAMSGTPSMGPGIVGNSTMGIVVSVTAAVVMLIALMSSHQYYRNSLRERNLLQAAREYTDSILRDIADGVIVIDEQGLVQSLNPAAERMFGYPGQEILGHNIAMLMPEPYRSQHDDYIRRYVETGVSKAIGAGPREVEGLRKDGTVFPLEVDVSEVRFGNQRLFAGIVRNIAERKRMVEILRKMATTDTLTGVFNRGKFNAVLDDEIKRVERYPAPLSLILFDIDHFKRINDTFGHQVGDAVLVRLAKLVAKKIRAQDIFARWGGEEFVILAPGSNLENTRQLAEKLRNSIEKQNFTKAVNVTCSFGIAELRQDENADSLTKRADDALYRAKENGRNLVEAG